MSTSLGQTVFMNDLTPVRVVATTNISGTYYNGQTNNGVGATLTVAASSLTVDGVALAEGDRLLLIGQTSALQNGIYVVRTISTTVILVRAFDSQSLDQIKPGQFTVVGAGTANAGAVYSLIEPLPQRIGVDAFVYVSSAQTIASVALTAAQFNGMYAAPVLLVPAPGAGKLLVLDRMELVQTYGSAAFAAGGVVGVQYDSTVNGAGVKASNTEAAADYQVTASTTYLFNGAVGAAPFSTTANKGLYLSNATAAFTTGDSTFIAKLHYHVITVA